MNQCLQSCVYTMGNRKQCEYIAELGGMNDEEREIYLMLHEGTTADAIQGLRPIDRKAYEKVEDSIRKKFAVGVIACVTYKMEHDS